MALPGVRRRERNWQKTGPDAAASAWVKPGVQSASGGIGWRQGLASLGLKTQVPHPLLGGPTGTGGMGEPGEEKRGSGAGSSSARGSQGWKGARGFAELGGAGCSCRGWEPRAASAREEPQGLSVRLGLPRAPGCCGPTSGLGCTQSLLWGPRVLDPPEPLCTALSSSCPALP